MCGPHANGKSFDYGENECGHLDLALSDTAKPKYRPTKQTYTRLTSAKSAGWASSVRFRREGRMQPYCCADTESI